MPAAYRRGDTTVRDAGHLVAGCLVTGDTERRLVFGEAPETYDQARAGYPDQLFDDVLGYAGVGAADPMVEVGAGTGIATRGFLARRLAVHVVEPSAAMAGVLRARSGARADLTVTVCGFEEWSPTDRCRLVAAAQSWHWVDPSARYLRARAALCESGALALFGHRPRITEGLRDEIERLYDVHAPHAERRPYHAEDAYAPEFAGELTASGLFDSVEHRDYRFRLRYDAGGYLALMTTMSDHRMLPAERRARLHEAIAQVIDDAGGWVDVDYRTDLYLGRARAG